MEEKPNTNILIELGLRKKWRNKAEWQGLPTVTCEEFNLYREGYGWIIKSILNDLATENVDINRLVEVRRADTLVFNLRSLYSWLNPTNNQPEHLKKENWNKENKNG